MTGFGRAFFDTPFGKLSIEIQSVNRRYLEVYVSLPKELSRFEQDLRKLVGEELFRGQVSIRVYLSPNLDAMEALLPDVEILKELKKSWGKIAHDLGGDAKKIDLPFIMQYLPVIPRQEVSGEEELPFVMKCAKNALKSLHKMKKAEGKVLAKDLENRLEELGKLIQKVEALSSNASEKMRKRLLEKIEEVVLKGSETDERVLREVAIFAEKVDITEEVIRFRSHIAQFKKLFKEEIVGRKIDFLIQEMGREINTIASKSMEAEVSHLVVEMKSELEKMREQVQNIE